MLLDSKTIETIITNKGDSFDINQDYFNLYKCLELDRYKNTVFQSVLFMMYYTFIKEIDTINRFEKIKRETDIQLNYEPKFSDMHFYNFKFFDVTQPKISINELTSILEEDDFILQICPLKKTVPEMLPEYSFEKNIIECSFDGNPTFKIKQNDFSKTFGLDICNSFSIDNVEIEKITNDILDSFISKKIITKQYCEQIYDIIHSYLISAFCFTSKINSWTSVVLNGKKLRFAVTDQTLSPAASFICQEVKRHNKTLVVLQHQRNLILSNLEPILITDFILADKYLSWFSADTLKLIYPKYSFNNLFQTSKYYLKNIDYQYFISQIEQSDKCLIVLNETYYEYINGISLHTQIYFVELKKILIILSSLNYKIYLKMYPNSSFDVSNLGLDFQIENESDIKNTFKTYDFIITDRIGNSTIEVLEGKGFVGVISKHYEKYQTSIFKKLNIDKTHKFSNVRFDTLIRHLDFLVSQDIKL